MSQLKLTADGSGGTVALKGPSTTAGNAAIELIVPGTGNATLLTSLSSTGKILQFVQVRQESIVSWNTTSFIDITGLTATINGVASGSKIIIDFCLTLGRSHNVGNVFNLMRDSTSLEAFSGAGFTFNHNQYNAHASYSYEMVNLRFVDTHGQSAGSNLVYKLQGHNGSSTNYVQYLNRRNYDSTQRGGCLMTLTEVAA